MPERYGEGNTFIKKGNGDGLRGKKRILNMSSYVISRACCEMRKEAPAEGEEVSLPFQESAF